MAGQREPEDAALVRALIAREHHAERTLWRRFAPMVFGMLRRTLGSTDVEDLAQVIFLCVFEKVSKLREPTAGTPICWCRPPLPALLLSFARRRDVDLAASTLIGAGAADQALARALGVRFLRNRNDDPPTWTVAAAVDTLQVMSKKDQEARPERKAPPERWRGDAVEERPGDEAERSAERAEGNTPVPRDVERERIQEPPDPDQQPLRVGRRPAQSEDPEEEIADAAEEHQERRAPNERPPRGKL